jgi:hypothetical protein
MPLLKRFNYDENSLATHGIAEGTVGEIGEGKARAGLDVIV